MASLIKMKKANKPRSSPSPAHYLLLAAIHCICQPGPKTEVADWYQDSILSSLWEFAPERFTSQAFWDCFDAIATGESLSPGQRDELEEAQLRLLGLWKEKQLVTRRLLAYDTTNFYTYIASNNERNSLAQRGHNKQGRHNLRQVGLSNVLDGDNGLSLCHHLYRGNVADAEELPEALHRIVTLLERNQIAPDSVTLVLDKGSSALANTLELEKAGVGWISALPSTPALDSGAGRVAILTATDTLEQSATGRIGNRGDDRGSRQGVLLRGEVLGFLCQRAVAQPDHQFEQGHAVSAPAGRGSMARPFHRRTTGPVAPDQKIQPAVSASGRQGTKPGGHCPFQTNLDTAKPGQGPGSGSAR
jgi:hypothetical protein